MLEHSTNAEAALLLICSLGLLGRGGLRPLKSVLAFLVLFGGVPLLRLSESNTTRREQNFPLGQIEIGNFFNFWCFEASLMVLEAFLIVPDVPEMLILSSSSAFLSCRGLCPPDLPKFCGLFFLNFQKVNFGFEKCCKMVVFFGL